MASARRARQGRWRSRRARSAADRRGTRILRGQDLSTRRRAGRCAGDLGESIESNYRPLVLALRACRCPSCARSTASPPAPALISRSHATSSSPRNRRVIQAFCKIGLVQVRRHHFLPRLGLGAAMGLAMLGDKLSAQQADWGLIWKCVDDTASCRPSMRCCAVGASAHAGSRRPSVRFMHRRARRLSASISNATCSVNSATAPTIAKAWRLPRETAPAFTGE